METHEKLKISIKPTSKLSKLVLTIMTVFLFIGLFYPFFSASKTVEVAKITDGDTIDVRLEGEAETLRFKGVDTPETEGYNTPEEYKGIPSQKWKCLESWGYKAKAYVEQRTEGREVTFSYRKGILTEERGAFNRLLGIIYLEGSNTSLNRALIEKGYARSYGDYYQDLEDEARRNSKGLWKCAE